MTYKKLYEDALFKLEHNKITLGEFEEMTKPLDREVEQEPTTKNDLAQERYQDLIDYFGDEKVSKIILENRGQFKAWLERLRWHVKRADELARELEQIKGTAKNDLADDCISRQEVLRLLVNSVGKTNTYLQTEVLRLPSVTPQEPQTFRWCTDCREYDQEKHCCHRWSKVIRNTVEEMKQEYIEREVLDKLRAEITTLQNRCYALTKGTMCAFCKYECEYKAESKEQKNEAKD